MKVLIVHAHENPDSFSSALLKTAQATLIEKNYEVNVSNLYTQKFNPIAGKHDFTKVSEAKHYKYALEQFHAHQNDLFINEIKIEKDKLVEADVLIFNFPLWWFGLPAILKGWVDRVLSYGFAYGGDYGIYEKGRFQGKKALMSITTGSPSAFYTKEGVHGRTLDDILRNTQEGILGLVGYEMLPPFIAYAVSRSTDEVRKSYLENYKNYLNEYF